MSATPPTSGEREVRRCEICLRETFPNGKDGYQFNLCFRLVMDDRSCYRTGYERLALLVCLNPSLAQCILAALEDPDGPGIRPAALADELRKEMGK